MMEKQPPKQIYLQAYDSDSYDDNTWCVDRINDEDIEYILQSEYDQLRAQNEFVLLAYHDSLKEMKARVEELEEALAKIANYESMRFKLSPYEYGLLEQIVGIAEHALRDGE